MPMGAAALSAVSKVSPTRRAVRAHRTRRCCRVRVGGGPFFASIYAYPGAP